MREEERKIRAEQDRALRESERKDAEKISKKRAEEELRRVAEEDRFRKEREKEERKSSVKEMKVRRNEWRRNLKERLDGVIGMEPPVSEVKEGKAVRISVKVGHLPGRNVRIFPKDLGDVKPVYLWVETLLLDDGASASDSITNSDTITNTKRKLTDESAYISPYDEALNAQDTSLAVSLQEPENQESRQSTEDEAQRRDYEDTLHLLTVYPRKPIPMNAGSEGWKTILENGASLVAEVEKARFGDEDEDDLEDEDEGQAQDGPRE